MVRGPATVMVHVEAVSKAFRPARPWTSLLHDNGLPPRRVLDAVSLHVADGEVFGLLGPNGAGKTTLFRILATLLTPDSGDVRIDGHSVRADPRRARSLVTAVLANERSLYWRLSARENLRLYAVLHGVRAAAIAGELDRVLTATGLRDVPATMVGTFSSGMRQRLLIARALLARPRVLLLDEPTRSLDPIAARDFRRFLRDAVVRTEGCTVLVATHDADDAWELCDRVAILHRGRVLASDETARLRARFGGAQQAVVIDAPDAPRARALLDAGGVRVLEQLPHAASLAAILERAIDATGAPPA